MEAGHVRTPEANAAAFATCALFGCKTGAIPEACNFLFDTVLTNALAVKSQADVEGQAALTQTTAAFVRPAGASPH
jgi:hypothetical protein